MDARAHSRIKKLAASNMRIGFLSRIDYGGQGFRQGLVIAGRERCAAASTHFDILVGGLISGPDIEARVRQAVKEKREELSGIPWKERPKLDRDEIERGIIQEVASELAHILPKRRKHGEGLVKLYIMVSPIPSRDGRLGEPIVRALAKLRNDIIPHPAPDEQFPFNPVPHIDFPSITCLVPVTQQMKSKVDSTVVDYVVEDFINRATERANVLIVGCVGSHIYKPKGGESSAHVISLPLLHKTQYKKKNPENQIGAVVLEITTQGDLKVTNYSFNDLVVNEMNTLPISPDFSEQERQLLGAFKDASKWRSGLLEKQGVELGYVEADVEKMLGEIVRKCKSSRRFYPPLRYDEDTQRYHIELAWLQKNLTYPWPQEPLHCERYIAFSCLHALSDKTDHRYFVQRVPQLMQRFDVDMLISTGDMIEGRAHSLAEAGKVIAGADYTQQEKFAGAMIAEVLLRSFEQRFAKKRKATRKRDVETIAKLIDKALPLFPYRPGNHDEWLWKFGVGVLEQFRVAVIEMLREGITAVLVRRNLPIPPQLGQIIEAKILYQHYFTLPSMLNVRLDHLHTGGGQAKTRNSQKLLNSHSKAHVLVHGNFHVAIFQARYDPTIGQRVVDQVPTIKRDEYDVANPGADSHFEANLGKRVDSGVGFREICSYKGRILSTAVIFFSCDTSDFKPFDNRNILRGFAKEIGIRNIKL